MITEIQIKNIHQTEDFGKKRKFKLINEKNRNLRKFWGIKLDK